MPLDFFEQIEEYVSDNPELVIAAFFRYYEQYRYELTTCSYKRHLHEYIMLKIHKRHYDRWSANIENPNYRVRILNYDNQLTIIRQKLYANPCYDCKVCHSRRKQWPRAL